MRKCSPRRMQRAAFGLVVMMGSLASFASAANAGQHFDPLEEVSTPAEQMVYEKLNPAVSMAPAWGDRNTGEHGTFGKFPANFITPLHTHTNAYHGVVIKGVMTNPFADRKDVPKMGPGSYWYVPATVKHTTACVSDTPCEFYFHADGAFDFKVVTAK